jgi:signal recognition particle receptor subunit beta
MVCATILRSTYRWGPTVANYNIVALGPSGSGKTVFLASLFHNLTEGQFADGIKGRTKLAQSAWLEEKYRELSDPTAPFGIGNDPGEAMRQVDLTLMVERTRSRWFGLGQPQLISFSPLTITYIDYAGEWLTEGHLHDKKLLDEFESRIDNAHFVICFVDGLRLLKFLQDSAADPTFLRDSMRPVLEHSAGRPVVVVITKWDLLADSYALSDVIKVLMDKRVTGLHSFVQTRTGRPSIHHRPTGGVWIVPVSATGSRFATMTKDGIIEKSGTGAPAPTNITVPFSVGMIEISRIGLAAVKRAQADAAKVTHRAPTGGSSGNIALRTVDSGLTVGFAGLTLDVKQILSFTAAIGSGTVQIVAGPGKRIARVIRRQYRRISSRGLDGVSSDEGALMYLALAFRKALNGFESEFTGARIFANAQEWTDQ